SSTVIVCVWMVVSPHSSVAVQVRAMIWLFAQLPAVTTSCTDTVAEPQLSFAVNVCATGMLSHSTVISLGNASTNVGAVVSSTVIVCVWMVVSPHSSVAVQVRAMVWLFAQLPAVTTSCTDTVAEPQLSFAVNVSVLGMLSHSTVISLG